MGLLTLTAGACSFGESGIPPPVDRVFLPTGLVVDPSSNWLYAVASNSDLRYNAGTVIAVDLRKVRDDRARRAQWSACPSLRHVPSGPFAGRFCCQDLDDPSVLLCDHRGYVLANATVRIGSFGGPIVLQCGSGSSACRDETPRRLFVGVRADPSVTFVDVNLRGDGVSLRCTTADPADDPNAFCDDEWRLKRFEGPSGPIDLAEEPFTLALDSALGVLYVGHLFDGVTVVDVCEPETRRPSAVSETPRVFQDLRQGVTSLHISRPGDPRAPIFATGRIHQLYAVASAEIQPLTVRGAEPRGCGPQGQAVAGRDMHVVVGGGFFSSAFYPEGKDIRGSLLSPDGRRLFVLHRNAERRTNPSALVAIELPQAESAPAQTAPATPTAQGSGAAAGSPPMPYRAAEVLEVCAGPLEMKMHDAGRGVRIFIVCFEAGQVYVVDPYLFTVVGVVNFGRGPTSIAFAPQEPTIAYVSEFIDNDIAVVDLRPGSPTEYRVVQRIGFPRASGK